MIEITHINQVLTLKNKINSGRSILDIYKGLGGFNNEDLNTLISTTFIPLMFPIRPFQNRKLALKDIARISLLLNDENFLLAQKDDWWMSFISQYNVKLEVSNALVTISGTDEYNMFSKILAAFKRQCEIFNQSSLSDLIGLYAADIPQQILNKIGQPTYVTKHLVEDLKFNIRADILEQLKTIKPYKVQIAIQLIRPESLLFKFQEYSNGTTPIPL